MGKLSRPTKPEKPSIAVLPFDNMSGDPEQEYFSDGITEDIITALSHFKAFPVIARNSTFTYKGQAIRVQQVAEELGARYVIEGSVPQGRGAYSYHRSAWSMPKPGITYGRKSMMPPWKIFSMFRMK